MSNIATVAASLNLNANLTFDDLVNVAVSKFEDQLVDRRTELQKRIKATEVERRAIVDSIKKQALSELEVVFPSRGFLGLGGVAVEFKVTLSNGTADDFLKTKQVAAAVTHIVLVDKEVNSVVTIKEYSGGDDKEHHKTSFNASAKIGQDLLTDLEQNNQIIVGLREQLLGINGELQGIDRKTRQVKALLAQQKMEELGLTDIMQSPEIAQLLALPRP